MTEARWLNAEERRAWLAVLALTTRLPAQLDSVLQRAAKITLFDYHVLAMLSESPGEVLPMSRLAERTNSSLSRLSHVVKKLQERGWVKRAQSAEDARVTVVQLLPPGRALLEDVAPEHVESVRQELFDGLAPQDVSDLARIGRKIVAHAEPEHWIFQDEA
ncbi:MAG: MarR family transcriptional regulator [Arthrobacter sp.]|jgi:DNA-binding MarR family transcriptional regulator|nr:MarR family transcriptional regulator [Arthrobacter sp.]